MDQQDTFGGKFFDGKSARQNPVSVTLVTQNGDAALDIEFEAGDREIWPASELREVTDQARDHGIVVKYSEVGIERLILLEDEAATAIRRICPDLGKKTVHKSAWRRLFFWAGGAIASVVIITFVILPALSNQLATMIPVEREAALGRTALGQIESFLDSSEDGLVCSSPAGDRALRKMSDRLTADLDIPYDLNVQVFDHKLINAFAVPGGNIVLFKGLLTAASTPEEVAGVLGHEIGHVVNRDPTRLTLRTAGSVGILGMVLGDFAGGALALVLTEKLISAQYAQDAEAKADEFAHEVLRDAGLPAVPFSKFFLKLKDRYGDSKGLMSHLASHPNLDGRAAAARAADTLHGEDFTPVLTPSEWRDLRAICETDKPENEDGDEGES